jgi:hypothetical protein
LMLACTERLDCSMYNFPQSVGTLRVIGLLISWSCCKCQWKLELSDRGMLHILYVLLGQLCVDVAKVLGQKPDSLRACGLLR